MQQYTLVVFMNTIIIIIKDIVINIKYLNLIGNKHVVLLFTVQKNKK